MVNDKYDELSNKIYQVFTHSNTGSEVLDYLIATFHVPATFDPTNERQSCFRQGQKDVIDHILFRMHQAERHTTV